MNKPQNIWQWLCNAQANITQQRASSYQTAFIGKPHELIRDGPSRKAIWDYSIKVILSKGTCQLFSMNYLRLKT